MSTGVEVTADGVLAHGEELEYGYLIIATGVAEAYYGVTGADKHSFALYTRRDAVALRDHIMAGLELLSRFSWTAIRHPADRPPRAAAVLAGARGGYVPHAAEWLKGAADTAMLIQSEAPAPRRGCGIRSFRGAVREAEP